jgi:hypothetical protein
MQNHQFAILLPLAVGVGAVECTIFVHALALTTTVNLFRREKRRGRLGAAALNDLAIIALVTSVAFVAHLAEIGLWAVLFVLCDEFPEPATAYYHSAVNYTTLGYGVGDSSWSHHRKMEWKRHWGVVRSSLHDF